MPSVRVYELARDLGIPSKDFVEELRSQGIAVKSHMSGLDEETAGLVSELYREKETSDQSESVPVSEESEAEVEAEGEVEIEAALSTPEPSMPADSHEATVVRVPEALTVKDLVETAQVKAKDVFMQLMGFGTLPSINTVIDVDTANGVLQKLGKSITLVSEQAESPVSVTDVSEPESLQSRAPVVTIMGHVDHGKTSLLDAIRQANIQATEAGGITQHIGAYEVQTTRGKITFLDTPGHEAFTSMRARGAQITDIVVLVVAANDGVMPQTREAVAHAQAGNVPIVVAVNKIDLEDANPDRIKQQLTELELVPEEWGGHTIFVEVSAKQNYGLDDLLEMILLQAEILELRADPMQMAKGTIIEARLDKTQGPVATVLIQKGTLQVGEAYVAGSHHGRVRAMKDDLGHKIRQAGPSTPVEVLGFAAVPSAGDAFSVVKDERRARQISSVRQDKQRTQQLAQSTRVTLDDLYRSISAGEVKDLNLVVKGDVHGSIQALWDSLAKLESEKVRLRLIHGSTGGITESDIMLASASNAIVIGFNVRPIPKAAELAEQEQVDVRLYTVIYEAISDVEKAMLGLLAPTYKEKTLGRAEVRAIFRITRVGAVAGCYVNEGLMRRNAMARVIRDSVVIHEGRIASLRRIKDDTEEVSVGFECGVGLGRYQDIKEGDTIESFMFEEIGPQL